MDKISFKEWQRMDIRVGKILEVKDHPEADKLYVLKVGFGEFDRWAVTSLKEYYKKEELEGKKFVFLVNLEPRTFKGVKSECMILAAVKGKECVLLRPEKEIEKGTRIE